MLYIWKANLIILNGIGKFFTAIKSLFTFGKVFVTLIEQLKTQECF